MDIGDVDEVVVAVDSDADEADDSFLQFDFFSFCKILIGRKLSR